MSDDLSFDEAMKDEEFSTAVNKMINEEGWTLDELKKKFELLRKAYKLDVKHEHAEEIEQILDNPLQEGYSTISSDTCFSMLDAKSFEFIDDIDPILSYIISTLQETFIKAYKIGVVTNNRDLRDLSENTIRRTH